MAEIVNLIEYKQEKERIVKKNALIKQMNTQCAKEEVDYTLLQILDLFCQKYYPEIYWKFDLFIDGKLK